MNLVMELTWNNLFLAKLSSTHGNFVPASKGEIDVCATVSSTTSVSKDSSKAQVIPFHIGGIVKFHWKFTLNIDFM